MPKMNNKKLAIFRRVFSFSSFFAAKCRFFLAFYEGNDVQI
jgi:hypothetical protein